jgi:hypothetical protein
VIEYAAAFAEKAPMQATLVAFYGPKRQSLSDLLVGCQKELVSSLGDRFRPYEVNQVHATVCGMEGSPCGGQVLNKNYRDLRGEDRPMDFGGVVLTVRSTRFLPMEIQMGGFLENVDYGFTSRGQHPYARSFSIQGRTAVVIGWPISPQSVCRRLDQLRRQLQSASLLHRYHGRPDEVDNDLFFALGQADLIPADASAVAEERLRSHLAGLQPVVLCLGLEDLCVVGYADPRLPLSSSRSVRLDGDPRAVARTVQNLYSR